MNPTLLAITIALFVWALMEYVIGRLPAVKPEHKPRIILGLAAFAAIIVGWFLGYGQEAAGALFMAILASIGVDANIKRTPVLELLKAKPALPPLPNDDK
ncbi:MAG TPA: hypothetical protein VK181_20525 [Rhizobium sp.]|nr:hypothetical protein [Rhizobium sp.]